MTTFTAVVNFDGTIEEVDVEASSEREARTLAEKVLADDYAPGGVIVQMIERIPGTYFI